MYVQFYACIRQLEKYEILQYNKKVYHFIVFLDCDILEVL